MGDHRIVKEKSKEGRCDPRIREGLGGRPKMYLVSLPRPASSSLLPSIFILFIFIFILIFLYYYFYVSCYYSCSCILFDIRQTWRASGKICWRDTGYDVA